MRIEARSTALLCAAIGGIHVAVDAAWIPGFTPQIYRDGDIIPLLQSRVFPPHRAPSNEARPLIVKQQTHVYAYNDLPIACPPSPRYTGSSSRIPLTLSHIARGDRISVSRHELIFGIDEVDKVLCSLDLDTNALRHTKELISQGYRQEWILDGLPGVRAWLNTTGTGRYYGQGVEVGARVNEQHNGGLLGKVEPPNYEIYNHVSLLVRYRTLGRKHERDVLSTLPETHWADEVKKAQGMDWERVIVGFELFPKSRKISKTMTKGANAEKHVQIWPVPTTTAGRTLRKGKKQQEVEEEKLNIPFTYSVYWREEKEEDQGGIEWGDRWQPFSAAGEEAERTVQYKFSVWLWLLWALLGYWLWAERKNDADEDGSKLSSDPPRTRKTPQLQPLKKTGRPKKSYGLLSQQHKDVTAPSALSDDEDDKHLKNSTLSQQHPHPPRYNTTLPPFLGAGIQVLAHLITIYPLYILNYVHAPYFSHFLTLAILIHLFLIPLSGYISFHAHAASSTSSSLRHHLPQQNTLLTICALPTVVFTATFLVNLSVWWQAGGTALPFTTLSMTCAAWVIAQSVLVYAGSWYAAVELTESNISSNGTAIQKSFAFASAARAVSIGLPISHIVSPEGYSAITTSTSSSSSTFSTKPKTPSLALAKRTLLLLLAATLPFALALLAAKIWLLASLCTITHLHAYASPLYIALSTELTCSGSHYDTLPFLPTNPSTPAAFLSLGFAALFFMSSIVLTSFYTSSTSTSTKQPPLSSSSPILHPFILSTSPSLVLFLAALYAYATNPLRPSGFVPAVLHVGFLMALGLACAMACAALGVVGVGVRGWWWGDGEGQGVVRGKREGGKEK